MTDSAKSTELRSRDAASLVVIGLFFSVLAFLVMVGTLWSDEFDFAAKINIAAGWILMIVGVTMTLVGWRWSKPRENPE